MSSSDPKDDSVNEKTEYRIFHKPGPVTLKMSGKGSSMLGSTGGGEHLKSLTESKVREYGAGKVSMEMPAESVPGQEEAEKREHTIISESASTSWSPTKWKPRIDATAYIHDSVAITGNVIIDAHSFIGAGVIIRGDNEQPVYIGEGATIQEGVIIRDLPTGMGSEVDLKRVVTVNGERYTVYIGERSTVCAQSQVHGPAHIGNEAYIGMQSLVFWARVSRGVVVEPGVLIMNVDVKPGVFVPAGIKVTSQKVVSDLPPLTSQYRFHEIGREMAEYNRELLEGYKALRRRV